MCGYRVGWCVVGLLKNVADNIAGRTICAFGEACAWPVQSFIAKFPEEFVAHATAPAPNAEPTSPVAAAH